MTVADSETVLVLSDIHGNAHALRRALDLIASLPHDHLVVLGDLLTYGPDVNEIVDLVAHMQSQMHALLLRGNHDQLYFDLTTGHLDYYSQLPPWIRESVDSTFSQLDVANFTSGLNWQDEATIGRLFLAHANPFGFGDWRYLNSESSQADAANRLAEREFQVGIFGHTHRAKICISSDVEGSCRFVNQRQLAIDLADETSRVVANAGSVGQPRCEKAESVLLRVTRENTSFRFQFLTIDYDLNSHLHRLRALPISEDAVERLVRYHLPVQGTSSD